MMTLANIVGSRSCFGRIDPVAKKRGNRIDQRAIGHKRMEFNRHRAAGVVKLARMPAEIFEINLADQRRLMHLGPLPFQSSESREIAKWKLHLVPIQNAQQDGFMPIVPQT